MAYKSLNPLPLAASDSEYVSITAFSSCTMVFPASLAIKGLPGLAHADSFRFFIQHAPSDTKLWFDLGVSNDPKAYPPEIQEKQQKVFKLEPGKNSPSHDVKTLGADPKDVKYIVASHAHWDHIFPVGHQFPNAKILCGKGTLNWATPNWPDAPNSTFDGRIWNEEHRELPLEELPSPREAPEKWTPIGPFKNGLDFFGDGSFWIVDAPGHCPGNLAGLARTRSKSGKTKWIFMGGDCYHCQHFVHHPEAPFGEGVSVVPTNTFHEDMDGAREIIRQIAEMKKGEGEDALMWPAHTDNLEGIWEIQ